MREHEGALATAGRYELQAQPFSVLLGAQLLRLEQGEAVLRLAFLPCIAPFILALGDLNRYVLRVEPTGDPYQAMVNAHSHEDDHHWRWFLGDFSKLGHDSPRAPSDTLRFHYSDSASVNRRLATQHQAETCVERRYCGEFRFQLESGYAMNGDHAALARIQLDEASRSWTLAAVDEVFSEFAAWTEELLHFSLALRDEGQAAPPQSAAVSAGV